MPQDWECLGTWKGMDRNHYLAIKDLKANLTGKPTYRCAVSIISYLGSVSFLWKINQVIRYLESCINEYKFERFSMQRKFFF